MKHLYQYAVLRVVPRPERGESINAGVALFCPDSHFLGGRVYLDEARLVPLMPERSAEEISRIRSHLAVAVRVCNGGLEAGALGGLTQRERFGRIIAPRNTVIQPSVVHTGFTNDPEEELSRLFRRLVTDGS